MPTPTANADFSIRLPTGTDWNVDLTGPAQTFVAIIAIVVIAAIVIRLANLFVRQTVKALLSQTTTEGADELTAADLAKRQATVESLGVNVIRLFVVVIAGLMLLETAFRLDIGPAIAGLGIAGIAVGLGTQHLVKDYLNGVLILLENQFAKGDVVNIAGIGGVVEDFTLRRTVVRDQNGTVHTVPNGDITVASNLTRAWARVNERVQVVYGTDIEKATAVIDGVGQKMADDPDWRDHILEAPHVERVNELGERGIVLLVQGKVRAAAQWSTAGELRRRLLIAFGENGIAMPQGVVLAGPAAFAPKVPADD